MPIIDERVAHANKRNQVYPRGSIAWKRDAHRRDSGHYNGRRGVKNLSVLKTIHSQTRYLSFFAGIITIRCAKKNRGSRVLSKVDRCIASVEC